MTRAFIYPQLADREWLHDQYEVRRRSTLQIAAEVGCTVQNVNQRLRRLGIPLRPPGNLRPRTVRYTRAEMNAAVGAAIDLLTNELQLCERDTDLLHLLAAAVERTRTDPAVTLDDVITRAYDDPPAVVRGWWDGWS